MALLTRREFSKAALVAPFAVPPSGGPLDALAAEPAPRPRKPNIVYIVSDELGYFELSCMGHKELRTPHIDRLASEGIRFTQLLAGASVCAPTRATLMTGKHTGHTSVRTNAGWEPLRAGEETIASMLQKAGYATGGFGKWGCGARGTSGVPETHGFDVFFGYYDQVHAHTFFPSYLIRNSQEVPLEGNPGSYLEGKTFSQYVIHDEAKKFLRANKGRPFFLYLPYTPPHGQYGFPDDDPSLAPYRDKPWPRDAKVYAAMVNLVDRQVGEILAMLKELGLDDDTIVFFSGDNGGFEYFADKAACPDGLHGPNVDPATGKRAFRGGKGRLYEGGLRVPYIVRWPGKIKPGRVSDHLGYFPDIMPALAELTGAACPADTDGLSILPELVGDSAVGRAYLHAEPAQRQHKYLYWEDGLHIAVREGTWKAVRTRGPKGVWELYDLATDLAETTDLAAKHPDILARLKGYAEEAHADIQEGEVIDRDLVLKDRYIPLGKPIPDKPWGPPAGKERKQEG
ncbi:MAG TPA: arylsulfatase [Planctomycetota bacterium]|nr:arylsulfatase [Planctomycetota bacterium]HRR82755.1 arylsulfatase [Planctomycetota bacterium]HRT93574.1 arylsulfatase [Planctomycetota bacterium]